MIDEKKLVEKLEKMAKESREESGLKEPALLQRIIKEVKDMAVNEEIRQRIEKADANDIAEALEKQIPKKPVEKHYEDDGEPPYIKYACPNGCGVQLHPTTSKNLAYEHAYCPKCGQRLDWRDVEPEIDWDSVPIDTPILVKEYESDPWEKRYFAGINKDGNITAWEDGKTSFTTSDELEWEYAKPWKGSREQVEEERKKQEIEQ